MRYKINKTVVLILLVASMLYTVSACSYERADTTANSHSSSTDFEARESEKPTSEVSAPTVPPLSTIKYLFEDKLVGWFNEFNLFFCDDWVCFTEPYTLRLEAAGIQDFSPGQRTRFFIIYEKDMELIELSGYTAPDIPPSDYAYSFSSCGISNMATDNNGSLWVLELWTFYGFETPVPDIISAEELSGYLTFPYDRSYIIRKLDKADGSEIHAINVTDMLYNTDIMEALGIYDYDISIPANAPSYYGGNIPSSFFIDNAANFYFVFQSFNETNNIAKIVVLDSDGNLQFIVDTGIDYKNLRVARTNDGEIVFFDSYIDNGGCSIAVLQSINFAAKKLFTLAEFRVPPHWLLWLHEEREITHAWSAKLLYSGNEIFEILYEGIDRESLYGINLETGETVHILTWRDYGIIPERIVDLSMRDDGSITCLYNYWIDDVGFCVGFYALRP